MAAVREVRGVWLFFFFLVLVVLEVFFFLVAASAEPRAAAAVPNDLAMEDMVDARNGSSDINGVQRLDKNRPGRSKLDRDPGLFNA
jgi:hypothetical protein